MSGKDDKKKLDLGSELLKQKEEENNLEEITKNSKDMLYFNLDQDDVDVEFLKKIISFHKGKWWILQGYRGLTGFPANTWKNEDIYVLVSHRIKDENVLFAFQLWLYSWKVLQLDGLDTGEDNGWYVYIEFLKGGKAKIKANKRYQGRWFENKMENEEAFLPFVGGLPEPVKKNRVHIRKVIEANNQLLGEKEEYTNDEMLGILDKISY